MIAQGRCQMATGRKTDDSDLIRNDLIILCSCPDDPHSSGGIPKGLHFERVHIEQIDSVRQHERIVASIIELFRDNFAFSAGDEPVAASGDNENGGSRLVLMNVRVNIRYKSVGSRIVILICIPYVNSLLTHTDLLMVNNQ